MPEGTIGITEGAGKLGHTFQRVIGANTVEDGVVIIGEPYLASYTVWGGAFTTATANSHLLQIMAGGTLKVRVRRIELHQDTTATAAALMQCYLCRLTSAGTGGTVQGANVLNPADAAAGATAMTLPTVKGTESTIITVGNPYMMQTIGASNQLTQPILVWDFNGPRSQPLIIAAGAANGIAIVNQTAVAAGKCRVNVWLEESNF